MLTAERNALSASALFTCCFGRQIWGADRSCLNNDVIFVSIFCPCSGLYKRRSRRHSATIDLRTHSLFELDLKLKWFMSTNSVLSNLITTSICAFVPYSHPKCTAIQIWRQCRFCSAKWRQNLQKTCSHPINSRLKRSLWTCPSTRHGRHLLHPTPHLLPQPSLHLPLHHRHPHLPSSPPYPLECPLCWHLGPWWGLLMELGASSFCTSFTPSPLQALVNCPARCTVSLWWCSHCPSCTPQPYVPHPPSAPPSCYLSWMRPGARIKVRISFGFNSFFIFL